MAEWRERGYVPDSDDEDEDDVRPQHQQRREENGTRVRYSQPANDQRPFYAASPSPPTFSARESPANTFGHVGLRNGDLSELGDKGGPAAESSAVVEAFALHVDDDVDQGSIDLRSLLESRTSAMTVANKLEVELSRGLQTVKDVLKQATPPSVRTEDDDSPLSSLPSSLQSSPRRMPSLLLTPQALGRDAARDVTDGVPPGSGASPGPSGRRSFRPRAPIQLHPYAIEKARYQQTWKARGLKPIDVSNDTRSAAQAAPNEDSQEFENSHSSQIHDSYPKTLPSSSNSTNDGGEESQSPIRGTRAAFHALYNAFGEELPDVSDILRTEMTPATGTLPRSRKTSQPRRSLSNAVQDQFRVYELPPHEDDTDIGENRMEDVVLDVPPSPPESGALPSSPEPVVQEKRGSFRTRGTPQLLPTPVLSSDKHTRKRPLIEIASSVESATEAAIGDDSSTSEAELEAIQHDSQGIKEIRRKIKGVLPASWLKLDFQRQKTTRGPTHQSPVKNMDDRGVARRLPTSTQNHTYSGVRNDGMALALFDEMLYASSESNSDALDAGDMANMEDSSDFAVNDVVEEDNGIEAMLPPRDQWRPRDPVRRTQRRFEDSGTRPSKTFFGPDDELDTPKNSTIRKLKGREADRLSRAHKRKKRRHRQTVLNVVEAPAFAQSEQPRFLELAARHGTKTGRARPQDPSKRFLRFDTEEDATDIHEERVNWQSGRSEPRRREWFAEEIPGILGSSPLALQPRLDVQAKGHVATTRLSSDIDVELASLKHSTRAILKQVHHRQPTTLHAQPDSPSPQAAQPDPSHLSSQFPHRNRSGHGRLLTRHSIRQAQMEDPQTVAAIHLLPVPRRVPKPASEAMRQSRPKKITPAQPSTSAEAGGIPPVPISLKPRRKKRSPVVPSMENDAIDSTHTESTPAPPGDHTEMILNEKSSSEETIILKAIHQLPQMSSLRAIFDDSSVIGSKTLSHTASCRNLDDPELMRAGKAMTALVLPLSRRTQLFTGWTSDIEVFYAKVLAEVSTAIKSTSVILRKPDCAGPEAAISSTALCQCLESLDSLILYNNASLSFENVRGRKSYVEISLDALKTIEQSISDNHIAVAGPDAQTIIQILNRLLVFTYQILCTARSSVLDGSVRINAVNIWDKLARLALSRALHHEQLVRSLAKLARTSGEENDSRGQFIADSTPAMETIVIIRHLSEGFPGQHHVADLDTLLAEHIRCETRPSPSETLARVALILCCVCPLVPLDLEGLFRPTVEDTTCYSGWHLLLPALTSFLNDYVRNKAGRTDMPRQLGLVIFKWCFFLVRDWAWEDADNLLKVMFKAYSENNMMDLFTTPSSRTAGFLDHDPRSVDVLACDDTDFDIFLKITARTLQQKGKSRAIANRVRSLVFSLSPNNSRGLREDQDLKQEDLVAMANCYDLYLTLYRYAPRGCQPRLSQIEGLIDFSHCHRAVCRLALNAWAGISESAVVTSAESAELDELAQWVQKMTFYTVSKFSSARQEVVEALEREGRIMFDGAERVIQANRRAATSQLLEIMHTWCSALKQCPTELHTRHLLKGTQLSDIILLSQTPVGLDDAVVFRIFDLVKTYTEKAPSARMDGSLNSDLHNTFRHVLADRLNAHAKLEDNLLSAMTDTWFVIAQSMVRANFKSWDDYLLPQSPLSFHLLAGTETSRQSKVLFVSKLIAADQMHFELDRFFFYNFWIESLLQPERLLRFEHILTNSILKADPDPLSLDSLSRAFGNRVDGAFSTLHDFLPHRLDVIRHLVRNIYTLQFNHEEDFPDGNLSRLQGAALLKTMASTMKCTWFKLRVPDRTGWADFIHAVLYELQVYSYNGFHLDKWFTDPRNSEFPKKDYILEDMFVCKPGAPRRQVDNAMIMTFRASCEAALASGEQAKWTLKLADTFCRTDFSRVDKDGHLPIDIPLQTRFIQLVFPAYIERAFRAPYNMLALPLLASVTELCQRLHLRIDGHDPRNMEEFAIMIATLLASMRQALQNITTNQIFETPIHTLVLGNMVHFSEKAYARWLQIRQYHPWSEPVASLERVMGACISDIYDCARLVVRSAQFPELVPILDDSKTFEVPDLDTRMGAFAAQDLMEAVRMNWEPRGTGGFYCRRGCTPAVVDMMPPMGKVRDFLSVHLKALKAAMGM